MIEPSWRGWMSRRQAAAYAGVSVETIDKWRKVGVAGATLTSVKKGRRVLIASGDLELFLRDDLLDEPAA